MNAISPSAIRGLVCLAMLITTFISSALCATYPPYLPSGISSLPQGTMLINADNADQLAVVGEASIVRKTPQTVEGQPFTKAIRVEVLDLPSKPWSIQTLVKVTAAVKKDDVFLFIFWARSVQTSGATEDAVIYALFQQAGGTNAKSLYNEVSLGTTWTQYCFYVKSIDDYATSGAQIGFHFGVQKQTVEVGGVELVAFGKSVTRAQLEPVVTKSTYKGRELNAAWRTPAKTRIEQIRKANLSITIKNNGAVVSGAQVKLTMKKHLFGFGTVVAADLIQASGTSTYMEKITELFNKAVLGNHLKWRYWDASRVMFATNAVNWLNNQGIMVRGHVLVWPNWSNMPEGVSHTDATLLQSQILGHIDTATTLMKDKLVEWDVVNEPFNCHDAMDLIGDTAMDSWFMRARAKLPNTKLYLNEASVLEGEDTRPREFIVRTMQKLISQGTPLDGIGVQGHIGYTPTPPEKIYARLDQLAALGKEIQVTEFDVNTTDETLQADYTRDFLTVCFSHPRVTGFLTWGFWEGHGIPEGAMFRKDWTPKPNLFAYKDLVFKEWWTKENGVTDAGGTYSIRGFKGTYTVTVTTGQGSKDFEVLLDADKWIMIDYEKGMVHLRSPPERLRIQQ